MKRALGVSFASLLVLSACSGDPPSELAPSGSAGVGGSGGAGGDGSASSTSSTSSTASSSGAGGEGGVAMTPCPDATTCVGSFPFHDERDTSLEGEDAFDVYPCKDTADESGPEIVYRVTTPGPGILSALIADDAGVDIDVHILSSFSANACLARDDVFTSAEVPAGESWIIADTYVSGSGPQSGAFSIDIGFARASEGPCELLAGVMPRVGDGGDALVLPAIGPITRLGHLVTAEEPAPFPTSASEELLAHYALTQEATGVVLPRSFGWTAPGGADHYGAGVGTPAELPVRDEAYYVAMYWTAEARPPMGTRVILRDPASGRAVVVAAGYATGPADLSLIGGASEEAYFVLGVADGADVELGFAADPTLPLGPRVCD
jgi:hypothetical protein